MSAGTITRDSEINVKHWPGKISLYAGLTPVLLFLAIILTLHLTSNSHPFTRMTFEVPLLLAILNTVFISLIGLIASCLALKVYQASGSRAILFFGCGMLSLALGAFAAGWFTGPWGPNVTTTLYNLSAFFSSIFHTAGIMAIIMEVPSESDMFRRQRQQRVVYTGLVILIALIMLATIKGIIPPFFIPGVGLTTIRQIFVAVTLVLFITASSSTIVLFMQKRVPVLYWYSLGLALLALNTFGALLQPAVGSPIGWAARGAGYLAGIYFLVVVVSALRGAHALGMTPGEVIMEMLRKTERKISFVFASMTDCYCEFDRQWRFTDLNDQCSAYFGREKDELIGQLFLDVFPEQKDSALEAQFRKAFSDTTAVHFEVKSFVTPENWTDVHVYPTEEGLSVFIQDITDRKRAEIALRESEQRWATTLASIGDAVIATDLEGNITFMNAVAEKLTGWILTDAGMKPLAEIFNIVNEQTRRQVESPVIKVLREGMVVGLANHTILIRKDCSEVPIDDSGAPIWNGDGKIIGVVLVFRDITDRKRAEQTTQHLASFPQINPNPVIEMNVSGDITFANPASRKVLQDFGMDKNDLRVFLPEDLDTMLKDWDKKKELNFQREVCVANRIFDEAVHFIPLFNVVRIYGRDITIRKQIEEKMRLKHEHLEMAQIAAGAGTWDWDIASGHLEWSSQLFKLFGLDPQKDEASFNVWNMVIHSDDREMANVKIEQALRKHEGLDNEYRIALPGKQVRWIKALGRGRYDENGHPIGMAGICIDVTEHKTMEEEISRSRDELEACVQERTLQLTKAYKSLEKEMDERRKLENQFRQAQKLEAMGTLAGGIAHDFNNILAGIIGFIEIVMEDVDPQGPEYRRLELAVKGAYRGRDLVKQILAFSRRAGQDRKPVVLGQVVEEALKLLRPALPSTIQIILQNMADHDMVLADSSQIHQVLMNLCTNAAHAMRENGGTLSISISKISLSENAVSSISEMVPGEYVILQVRDTGCGMTSDVLERIFDPFFTTKKQGEGTGLGLSMVHGILKGHGGYITVESEQGKGTVVRVYLPKIDEEEITVHNEISVLAGNNECILFVDDEDILVELNKQRLSRLGYEVVATTNSLDALDLFRKTPHKFDLVITDYTMPKLTGMDLAAELLKIKATIPIILYTGYNELISPEQVKESGIRAFLMKPLGKQELAQTIRHLLDEKKVLPA